MNELYIIPVIFFVIGGIFLFLALWSRDPKHLGSAVGTLADSKKVMRRRGKYDDRKYPATACTYTYQVGGKTYRIRREGFFGRSGLLRKVTVVYLKAFPRFGCPEKFPVWLYVLLGGMSLFYGIAILFAI